MKQPLLKIGIVLPEDKKNEIQFTLPPSPDYFLEADGTLVPLHSSNAYFIRAKQDRLELWYGLKPLESTMRQSFLHDVILTSTKQEMKIFSNEPVSLEKNHCITIHGVIAGRNFHWRKEIAPKLPGEILVRNSGESIFLINLLPLEAYLPCVAVSEMSEQCPAALLEAQTVAARSWLLAHAENKHPGLDACNDDCCQRYQGVNNLTSSASKAADATYGEVLCFEGKICDTRYSKCCGGMTESAMYIWPGTDQPYLTSFLDIKEDSSDIPRLQNEENMRAWVSNSPSCFCSPAVVPQEDLHKYLGKVDSTESYFRWKKQYSVEEISKLISQKAQIRDMVEVLALQHGRRGRSGRLREVIVHYRDRQNNSQQTIIRGEQQIRFTLHPSFLYSSAFVVDETRDEKGNLKSLLLTGAGWGHGVGLCQMGALGMALQGYSCDQILSHYFPGTELTAMERIPEFVENPGGSVNPY